MCPKVDPINTISNSKCNGIIIHANKCHSVSMNQKNDFVTFVTCRIVTFVTHFDDPYLLNRVLFEAKFYFVKSLRCMEISYDEKNIIVCFKHSQKNFLSFFCDLRDIIFEVHFSEKS